MKKLVFLVLCLISAVNIQAQTLIATSLCPEATANHNQRKIVRNSNNIFVVYTDSLNQQSIIKGLFYSFQSQQWSSPATIISGRNPSLAIAPGGKIHLFFETNDTLSGIRHMGSTDFINWSPVFSVNDTLLKARLPVADCDSTGKINIFWIQHNDNLSESLMYASLQNDSLMERKCITTKSMIEDIAIANHLQYFTNELFFAIQFNQDSLQFFRSATEMYQFSPIYSVKGTNPCITYNSFYYYLWPGTGPIRLLYIDQQGNLVEVEADGPNYTSFDSHILQTGPVDYVCIDDLAFYVGYSYLFMKNSKLYHGFSFGLSYWQGAWWNTIMDTIPGNPQNPSLAYKYYNFGFVDFIWMESTTGGFNIFYKRDPKNTQMGIVDNEPWKGFSITGFPNPFAETINITVEVKETNVLPILQVINANGQLIRVLKATSSTSHEYSFIWNGTNEQGDKLSAGTYVILCNVGEKRVARKVFLTN